MNTKIVHLLNLILQNNGCLSFENACSDLDCTKRMVLYYQKMLNDHLKQVKLPITYITNGLIKLDYKDEKKFKKIFDVNKLYAFKSEERIDLILLKIGLSAKPVILEQLYESLNISRSTVISDIHLVREYLNDYDITLQSKPKKGYFLQGDEIIIRYVLMKSYYNTHNQFIKDMKYDILLNEVSIRYGKEVNITIFASLEQMILDSERHTGKQFSYFSINSVANMLLFVYLRSFYNHVEIKNDKLKNYMERYSADVIVSKMNDIGFSLPDSEITYVQTLLMGAKIYTIDNYTFDSEVESFAYELLSAFENLSQIKLPTDSILFQMLLLHIRPMFYRMKYYIKVSSDIGMFIRKTENCFYNITKLAINSISDKYDIFIDEDEITYLSLYFSCIGQAEHIDEIKENNILVVCGSGLGSSFYVKNQLEKIMGNNFNYIICDIRNINRYNTENLKLIVSSIDLDIYYKDTNRVKSIIVSTVITEDQKSELINWLLENIELPDNNIDLNQILNIVSKSAEITNKDRLVLELRNHFNKNTEITKELGLQDIFKNTSVNIVDEETNWMDAMYIAGQPLVSTGLIKEAYIEDIIDVINELGPYAECQKGILLAHAKPQNNVNEICLSVAHFKIPIYMEKWDKNIDTVFILAVTDYKSHANALVELISNLSKAEVMSKLDTCKTPQQLYDLICLNKK